jgi:hypothetical protein
VKSVDKVLKSNLNLFFNNNGNVAVTVALMLSVLLGVMAFTIDTGYLYSEKNRYQNAVEAAAMAGAIALCEKEPEEIAEQVLMDNLVNSNKPAQEMPNRYRPVIAVGYYDEIRQYDFSESSRYGYRHFIEIDRMPTGLFENAVLVRLTVEEGPLVGGLVSEGTVEIGAAAVAYAVDFDMVSLSTEDPIVIDTDAAGFPEIRNMWIHSNHDINCVKQAPQFENVSLSAAGYLRNCVGSSGQPEVSLPQIDWDDYRSRAEVFTYQDFVGGSQDAPIMVGDNRGYVGAGGISSQIRDNPVLELREGFHNGAIYYYSAENDPDADRTLFISQFIEMNLYSIRGLTVVSEIPVAFNQATTGSSGGGRYGGMGEDVVTIISAGSIRLMFVLKEFFFDGVVFQTEDEFYDMEKIVGFYDPTEIENKIKVIAHNGIRLFPPLESKVLATPVSITYSGQFMPPCGHHLLRWGKLE